MARKKKAQSGGNAPWLATYADTMTLLMAFFVLLLSLAEIDAVRYRALAGEMRRALGVEVDSKVPTLPDGTLDKLLETAETKPEEKLPDCALDMEKADQEIELLYDLVKGKLSKMAADHELFVQKVDKQIIIRIQEQGVFPSGSDKIQPPFLPKIAMLRGVLAELQGGIRVTGHTDDVPIHNGRYRSNWELSAARAVSVVHELMKDGEIAPHRLSAVGYGESRPLAPNVDNESRARNRRVDIIITATADPMPGETPNPPDPARREYREVGPPTPGRDAPPGQEGAVAPTGDVPVGPPAPEPEAMPPPIIAP